MIYKVLDEGGKSYGGFQWSLPVKNDDGTWIPVKWTPKIDSELKPCKNGWAAMRRS